MSEIGRAATLSVFATHWPERFGGGPAVAIEGASKWETMQPGTARRLAELLIQAADEVEREMAG